MSRHKFLQMLEKRELYDILHYGVMCMTTGDRIKAARKRAGLTQKELGERVGRSFQAIAQWENNLRNPKYETLELLATALGTTPAYLQGTPDDTAILISKIVNGWYDEEPLAVKIQESAEKHGRVITEPDAREQAMAFIYALSRGGNNDEPLSIDPERLDRYVTNEILDVADLGLLALQIQNIWKTTFHMECDAEYAEELALLVARAVQDGQLDQFLKLYIDAKPTLREAAMLVLRADSEGK